MSFRKVFERGIRYGWVDIILDEDMIVVKVYEKEGNGCEVFDFCRVLLLYILLVIVLR